MQFKHVTLDIDGPVAILKLDHQEVMNAVSIDMLGGLGEALDAIEDKKAEVRCLVITGAGRAFCTGANLQGRNNQKPGKSNAGAALETAFHPFLRRLRNAKTDAAIAAGDDGDAAGQIKDAVKCLHWAFPCDLARVKAGRPMAGRCSCTNHGQARLKNQIWV